MKLPGDDFYPGLWPALWMMGNLGRAGYMETTDGAGTGSAFGPGLTGDA